MATGTTAGRGFSLRGNDGCEFCGFDHAQSPKAAPILITGRPFRYVMEASPNEVTDSIGTSTAFATWNAAATGNRDSITIEHMRAMKDRAIVCNIGHFGNKIQIAHLKNLKWDNIKPQVDEITVPDNHRIILLPEGRLVNLGNAMGHPSFVISASFTNQTLAQIELFANNKDGKYKKEVYVLPKSLDEKVARLQAIAVSIFALLALLTLDGARFNATLRTSAALLPIALFALILVGVLWSVRLMVWRSNGLALSYC
jgi:hypothetical protein